jgi:hypothetical protein
MTDTKKIIRETKPEIFTDYPRLGEVPEFVFAPITDRDFVGGKRVVGVFHDPRALALAQKYVTIGLTGKEAKMLWKYMEEVFFPAIGGCPKALRGRYWKQAHFLLASELVARTFEGC